MVANPALRCFGFTLKTIKLFGLKQQSDFTPRSSTPEDKRASFTLRPSGTTDTLSWGREAFPSGRPTWTSFLGHKSCRCAKISWLLRNSCAFPHRSLHVNLPHQTSLTFKSILPLRDRKF